MSTATAWVGAAHDGSADRFSDVTDPATGEVAARLALVARRQPRRIKFGSPQND